MDIKEIALKVADSLRNKVDGISHMQSNQGLVRFADALIESYKAELLKEAGEPDAYLHQWIEYHPYGDTFAGEPCSAITNDGKPFDKSDTVTPLYTLDQLAAAIAKATKPLEKEVERLKKHQCAPVCIFHEGDEREELKKQLAAAQEEIERLKHSLKLEQQLSDSLKMAARMPGTGNYVDWIKTIRNSHDQLAKAEQRVAEACALQVATETKFHWLDAARVAKEIRSGEWRKFVKEV